MRKAAIPLVGLMFLAASWGASPAQSATTWKKVGNVFANFAQPGLERTSDGVLHAVWVHEANNTFTLEHTPISAGGAVGSTILVQSNWVQMAAVPDLVPDPQSGGLRAFWGGTRTTNFGETNTDLNTATAPASGTPWTLTTGNVAQGAGGFTGEVSVTLDAAGNYFEGSERAFVHRGLDPNTTNYDYEGQFGSGNGYYAGLATDTVSGNVWMAWFSLSTGHNGLYAQQVDTTTGAPVGTPSHLATSTDALIERTPIAARAGGGIDVAYISGSNIDLWKIGPSGPGAPIVIAKGTALSSPSHPAVAADGNGRVWVAWAKGGVIDARRSNRAGTLFGATSTLRVPSGLSLYELTINAQASTLDVLGTFSDVNSNDTLQAAQIHPKLSLAATPTSFKGKKTVTFKVTDAGAPVSGALVSGGGKHAKTNASGVAKIAFGPYAKKTVIKVTASHAGYVAATIKLVASP